MSNGKLEISTVPCSLFTPKRVPFILNTEVCISIIETAFIYVLFAGCKMVFLQHSVNLDNFCSTLFRDMPTADIFASTKFVILCNYDVLSSIPWLFNFVNLKVLSKCEKLNTSRNEVVLLYAGMRIFLLLQDFLLSPWTLLFTKV